MFLAQHQAGQAHGCQLAPEAVVEALRVVLQQAYGLQGVRAEAAHGLAEHFLFIGEGEVHRFS